MQLGQLSPKAKRSIHESTARINIWHGAVRSGKTVTSLLRWIEYVATAPEGDLMMVGKTERTLYRNAVAPLVEMLGPKLCRYVRGSGELYVLGRRIWIVGANDERAESKIRGATLAGAYGDELTLWPESFFRMLLTRLSVPGAKFFGTTNPDAPRHWLRQGFLLRGPEIGLRSWRFTLRDNPHLSPEYIEALEREHTGLWRQRFIEGMWVAAEGAVYDMLDEQRHVVDELPRLVATWIGLDYGTTNPFVAVLVGLGEDLRLYVAREYRWDSQRQGRQKTDAEYSADLRAWYTKAIAELEAPAPRWIYFDPSAASFGLQLWRDKHPSPRQANNDVLRGIRVVSSLLAQDKLRIHRSCTGLLEELQGYRWDSKAQEHGEDKPLKEADHGPDALRYAVLSTEPFWRRRIFRGDERRAA